MSCENVTPPASTPGIDALMAEYSLTEDKWDDNLMWFFAVAHVLWHMTAEEIPAKWGYGHGNVDDTAYWCEEDSATAQIMHLHAAGVVTDDDLINFGHWLHKIDEDFRSRGENY